MVTESSPAQCTKAKAPTTPVLLIQQLDNPADAPEWSRGIYDQVIADAVSLIPKLQVDMRHAQLEQQHSDACDVARIRHVRVSQPHHAIELRTMPDFRDEYIAFL